RGGRVIQINRLLHNLCVISKSFLSFYLIDRHAAELKKFKESLYVLCVNGLHRLPDLPTSAVITSIQ
ncbi:MAG: hypothetical protein OEM31_09260, partial [Gammaproteobacteria bacterium]|nr:hypothetical protein [Gammaproteobacteria bacterium]